MPYTCSATKEEDLEWSPSIPGSFEAHYKWCPSCKKWVWKKLFTQCRRLKDGLDYICKECKRTYAKDYYESNRGRIRNYWKEFANKNPEKMKQKGRKYYLLRGVTVSSCAKELLKSAKRRAKNAGVIFSISTEFIEEKLADGICPMTGWEFDLSRVEKGSRCRPKYPSIDRITPGGPYTEDNVRVVCTRYNLSKLDYSDAEELEYCMAVVAKHKK